MQININFAEKNLLRFIEDLLNKKKGSSLAMKTALFLSMKKN